MADQGVYADLLDALSPLTAAGIDPDAARMDRAGTMQKLLGQNDAPETWLDAYRGAGPAPALEDGGAPQQTSPAPAPAQADQLPAEYTPSGVKLPQGLHMRQPAGGPAATAPDPNDPALQGLQSGYSGQGAAAPPATVGPGGGSGDDYTPYVKAGLAGTLDLANRANQTVRQMEGEPSEAQVLQPLQDKLEAASRPLNPNQRTYDPNKPKGPGNQPGQMNYRPSFAQRLIRGVEGFAGRGVFGVVDPELGGAKPYGAPNQDYDLDEATRQAKVQTTTERLKQTAQAYKDAQEQMKARLQGQNETAGTYDKLPTAVTGLENAATAQKNAQTNRLRQEQGTPEAKAAAVDAQQKRRIAQLQDSSSMLSKIPLEQQLHYVTSGEVSAREPRQATPEEINQQRVLSAWQADPANKGKRPTVEQWGDIIATAYGRQAPSEKGAGNEAEARALADAALAKKKGFTDGYKVLKNGSYLPLKGGNPISAQEFHDKLDSFRTEVNPRLQKLGFQIDEQGNFNPTQPNAKVGAPAPGGSAAAPALPDPRNYAEGTVLRGKNGEKVTKRNGRWQ